MRLDYKKFFESFPDAVFIADTQTGEILECNQQAERLIGRPRDEVIGMYQSELHPPEKAEKYKTMFQEHVKKGEKAEFEAEVQKKDGSRVPITISARVMDIAGKRIIAGVFTDITEHKKTEEKLQAILNNSPAVIFVKDLEGKYLLINNLYEKLFHVSKMGVIGKTDHDLFPQKAADAFRKADLEVLKLNKPLEAEEVVPQDDGTHYYISLKFPLYDTNSKPYAVCGIAADITERKRTEEKIKETSEEWIKTFNAMADLVFIQNKEFTITKVNKAFAEALKLRPEDIVGRKCYELLHKRDKPWPECPFEKTMQDKKYHVQEVDDPNIGIPLLVTTSPIFNDKGEVIASVHIARDISEIKNAKKELEKKIRDLEAFHKLAVGRELKMEELKARIAELETKLKENRG